LAASNTGTTTVTTASNALSITADAAAGNLTVDAQALTNDAELTVAGGANGKTAAIYNLAGDLLATSLDSVLTVTLVNNEIDNDISITTGSYTTTINDSAAGDTINVNATALAYGVTLTTAGAGNYSITGLKGNLNNTSTGTMTVSLADTTVDGNIAITTGANTMSISNSASGDTVTVDATAMADNILLTTAGAGNYTISGLQGNLINTSTGIVSATLANNNDGGYTVSSSTAITIANGTAQAGDTITLAGDGSFTINGLVANLSTLAAIAGSRLTVNVANYNITITDAASIAQLTTIDTNNGSGILTYTTIKDTAANLVANVGGYETGNFNIIVSDTVTIAQLTTIDGYTPSGTLTVADTGKISDTFANLLNDRNLNGGSGKYVINSVPHVEISVSATGLLASDVHILSQVTNIALASGATLTVNDNASNVASYAQGINAKFGVTGVIFNVTGALNPDAINAFVDLDAIDGVNLSNVFVTSATFPDAYTLEQATWAGQHGFNSQMIIQTPVDLGVPANTLQTIDVVSLNAAGASGVYSYEGLLKSILNAGWTNVLYTGSAQAEVVNLNNSYGNANRSFVINAGDGADNITGTSTADIINGENGNDVLNGGNGADTINGGSGDDTIIGGTGVDTMTGGSGSDTFTFAANDSGTISGSVYDIITDYMAGIGGDKLNLVGTPATPTNVSGINMATASGNIGSNITASITNGLITLGGTDASLVDTLDEWLGVARGMVTTNTNVGAFQFGGNTYVYQENTGGDLLIQLQGVTGITGVGVDAAASTIWVS